MIVEGNRNRDPLQNLLTPQLASGLLLYLEGCENGLPGDL